jgi:hypothetical protein
MLHCEKQHKRNKRHPKHSRQQMPPSLAVVVARGVPLQSDHFPHELSSSPQRTEQSGHKIRTHNKTVKTTVQLKGATGRYYLLLAAGVAATISSCPFALRDQLGAEPHGTIKGASEWRVVSTPRQYELNSADCSRLLPTVNPAAVVRTHCSLAAYVHG